MILSRATCTSLKRTRLSQIIKFADIYIIDTGLLGLVPSR